MSSPIELQIKKLYKESVDCVRYLDRLMTLEMDDLSALFSSKTLTLRNKLCDYCEKILFLKPLIYGKRAEEIIWRKCFYEPIHKIRKSLHNLSENDRCQYYMHLSSASGYYSSFLIKIQQEFHFELPSCFDIAVKQLSWNKSQNNIDQSKSLHDFAFTLCHRVLIYLGDLARYQQEFEQSTDIRLAQHYYHWALRLKPFHGQPHNQLGTLFADRNFGIDAALCYLRCIFSAESFMGADGNLVQLLERSRILYISLEEETTKADGDDLKNLQMKSCVLNYLNVFKLLYDDVEDKDLSSELAELSQKVLSAFSSVIENAIGMVSPSSQQFCCGSLLKIFVCQTILIKKLQDKASYKTSASIALLVNLFILLLDRVISILPEDTKANERISSHPIVSVTQNGGAPSLLESNRGDEVMACNVKQQANVGLTKKPNVRNFMQRRRRRNVSDEDENDLTKSSDEDDVIEIDDSDEDAVDQNGTIGEPLGNSDNENDTRANSQPHDCVEIENCEENDAALSLNDETPLDRKPANNRDDYERPAARTKDVLKFLVENAKWLTVIKIVCDWFRCHPNLITHLVTTLPKLFQFINWLPNDDDINNYMSLNEDLSKELRSINICKAEEFEQKYALVEDVYLRGIPSLTQAHTGLDFESQWFCSPESETIARFLCMTSFAHYLIKLNMPGLWYDEEKRLFFVQSAQSDENLHTSATKHLNSEKSEREALMRNMAKLRIKDELKSIEKVAWIPVYLILDTSCLLKSASAIKRLLARRKFILVIPESVLSRLDRLKKDSVDARDAIRWLETQLKSGNKYIRAQKGEENANNTFSDAKFMPILKECLDTHEVCGVVDCSAYFSRTVTGSRSTVACILTGDQSRSYRKKISDDVDQEKKTNYKEIYVKLIEVGDIKGVGAENARMFLDRWLKYDGGTNNKRNVGRRRRNS